MKFALWIAAASIAAAQTQGVVVDAVTGAPLPGAYVSIGGAQRVARTDAAGHFAIEGRPLQVERAGYVEASNVHPDQSGAELTIRLTPAAVIAGKLVDQDGFPDSGATVELLQYRVINGERRLFPVVMGQPVRADDLGEYRIGGLRPGRYYLRISGGTANNWDRRYVTQYYGGTTGPKDENRIEVKAGEVHDKTDMTVMQVEGGTLSGRIEGLPQSIYATGAPMLHLASAESAPALFSSTVQPDGAFTITHVTPGKYKLTSEIGAFGEAGSQRAEMALEVGANDLSGLTVALHTVKPVDIAGAFVLAGGGTPGPMKIALSGGSNGQINGHSEADGSFLLKGVLPGHYQVQSVPDFPISGRLSDVAASASPYSAMLGEVDVLRKGFDVDSEPVGALRITLGPSVQTGGKVVDAAGQPVAGVMVYLLSSQDTGVGMTHDDGTYRTVVRVPGTYHVYLMPDQTQPVDADYLDAHQNDFPPVKLVAGENPPLVLVRK